MTNVEEDVVLARVSYIAREVLAHDAVPVGRVLLVEVLLDELGDLLLVAVVLVYGHVHLFLDVRLHVRGHLANDPVDVSFGTHIIFKIN